MIVTPTKRTDIQLSNEEVQALNKAKEVLVEMYEHLSNEGCDYVSCKTDHNWELSYSAREIQLIARRLEDLGCVTVMF